MSRRTTYICDICKNGINSLNLDINKGVVNAEVYGVHMHISCFKALQPLQLIKLLGLDEITIGGEKLVYIDEGWFNQ